MNVKPALAAAATAAVVQFSATSIASAITPDRSLFAAADTNPHVILAQSSDPRVIQLEEQVRQLNGRVEELNFLVLQMQEQMRRMQEDNDFRFQELEDSGRTGEPERKSETDGSRDNRLADGGQTQTLGDPPRNLGEVIIGADGSVSGATTEEPMDLLGRQTGSSADGTTVAALPTSGDPNELYSNAYEFILSGDYVTAEAGFRRHLEDFPDDERSADAHYWLGEAILAQQRPAEAAEVFLAASRNYPDSRKAPEMLLKLGMSLAALGQRDIACATFREVGVRYPGASGVLKGRVKQEQAIAGC
ncbi:MAG: tol-pal system protein YbgF [Rhizobiaceae bacterium]